MREPRVGDVVAVPVTGAYCYTMRNGYNGALRPPVVFVRDGDARVAVRRERTRTCCASTSTRRRSRVSGRVAQVGRQHPGRSEQLDAVLCRQAREMLWAR
jgi:hypothetical protein